MSRVFYYLTNNLYSQDLILGLIYKDFILMSKKNFNKANKEEPAAVVNAKDFIEVEGEVLELKPGATFVVRLENEHEILCHLSGRMRMHKIKILPGDKVKVEMSPYDLSKGRITYRM